MTKQIATDNSNTATVKKGLFRVPGIAAFGAVSGILVAGTYFLSGPLIKSAIEASGTEINGAEVAVDSVSLNLFPASLTLQQVTVADAQKPMQNVLEFSQATASIDLLKLLMGQIIVPDLALRGLQFETPRQHSGAISKKKEETKNKEEVTEGGMSLDTVSQSLPSAKEILAREPLLIDQRKKELDSAYQEQKAIWESIEAKLPDSDKLKSYEQSVKLLTKTKVKSLSDFNAARKELEQLKTEIKADKKTLEQAKSQFSDSKEIVSTHLDNLKKAPQEDWERIKSKYSFDEQGISNLSGLLFGEKFAQYTEKALYFYQKVEPFLSNEKDEAKLAEDTNNEAEQKWGRFVRFPEDNPQPDFLIEEARISASLSQGDIDIIIKDITHQQNITGTPTTLSANSSALSGIKEFKLDGVLDYRKAISISTFNFKLDDTSIKQTPIGDSGDISLELDSALADINGQLSLKDHNDLNGNIGAQFSQAAFTGEAPNRFTQEVLGALQSINDFNIDAELQGTIEDFDASISSDLDKRLKNAFSNRLNQKKDELQEEINKKLQEKLAAYLPEAGSLDFAQAKNLDDYSAQLDKLLKSKVDDFKKQQTDKLKEKAKEKLKEQLPGKLRDFF